jgi:hypothetical protein
MYMGLQNKYILISLVKNKFGRIVESVSLNAIFVNDFYLQAVQIHSANGVKLLEAWRGVLSSTPPYK